MVFQNPFPFLGYNWMKISVNFICLLRVVITPSVTTLLREENDLKQSNEIQARLRFFDVK